MTDAFLKLKQAFVANKKQAVDIIAMRCDQFESRAMKR